MPTKSFTASPEQVAHMRAQLATNGINVPEGNTGEITGRGITARFTYDGTATLNITVTDKPWYIPASKIFGDVQTDLDQVATSTPAQALNGSAE